MMVMIAEYTERLTKVFGTMEDAEEWLLGK